MTNKRLLLGSNQYRRRERTSIRTLWIFWGTAIVLYIAAKVFVAYAPRIEVPKSEATGFVSPLAEPIRQATPSAVASPAAQLKVVDPKEGLQEKIESYIRTIFGREGNVAIAVSRNECSPSNAQYPTCVYHTEHEYSVGIWQINLHNSKHWIHAGKVPGDTMAEKIEALKDPYLNTLIAYKIYIDSGGFYPWSAYTNKSYLKDL